MSTTPSRRRTKRRHLPRAATWALIPLALAGCGSADFGSAESYVSDADTQADYAPLEGAAVDDFAEAGSDGLEFGSAELNENSAIIVTGYVTVRTSTPQKAAEEFSEDVLAAGGEVSGTQQSEWENDQSVTLDVRIPPDSFDAIVSSLSGYGKVVDETTWSEDVGLQVADLSARRDALEQSIERLQQLMAKAETTDELLQAESILTERQSQLDSLNSQLQWLERQVEMSSLTVTFTDAPTAGTGFSWAQAWNILLESFRVVGYALVVLVPWALIAAAVFFAIRAVVRARRKSSTKVVRSGQQSEPQGLVPEATAEDHPNLSVPEAVPGSHSDL